MGLMEGGAWLMPKLTQVRALTADERSQLKALAHSRTEPAGLVQRATIIWLLATGQRVATVAAQLQLCDRTLRRWVYRFNDAGLAGLRAQPRSGRPPTYSQEQRSEVVAASLTAPQSL